MTNGSVCLVSPENFCLAEKLTVGILFIFKISFLPLTFKSAKFGRFWRTTQGIKCKVSAGVTALFNCGVYGFFVAELENDRDADSDQNYSK